MKLRCSIPCAWFRRAISFCRGLRWRACTTLSCVLVALPVASWFAIDWPEAEASSYPGGIVLRDDAGEVMRVSLGPGDVDCRPYYQADPDDWVVKALVAAEDGTFWEHRGVRPLSILRAAGQNLFHHRRVSGASTITMQAVRLMKPHPKTLWWKFREAVMALKLERARDKRWILSQYLNRAPFGSNLVGIEAAAGGWFGKSARELGIGEAAMLAGMVQAPSRFRPDRGYERALRRRDYVLGRMLETGVIDEMQFEAAKSVLPEVRRSPRPFRHPYFCDYWMKCLCGREEAGREGGDITTTLNADIQSLVDTAVNGAAGKGGYSVAAVVMRADTGAVVSLACSGDYFDRGSGQVNTALSPRPAGSTLKPFLTALAIDRGYLAPGERLADVPMTFKGYSPANFDSKYRGLVTVRDSLVQSLNLPFVRLLERVGVNGFGANLRDLGFSHLPEPDESYGLGMAIGNVEVSLVELVGAYGVLARGGDGVYSRAVSYLVADMLSGTERSRAALGHVADVAISRFAWKTGTSSAYRDAWTVLWNPEYVVGVWCGHKTGGFGDQSLVGAKAAAPVAWTIARALYPRNDGPWYTEPEGIIRCRICSGSGLPAGPHCPIVETGIALSGRSASRLCALHRLDAEGRVVEDVDPYLTAHLGKTSSAKAVSISCPEDETVYHLVPGLDQQKIVCKVTGNPAGSRLWWFIDEEPAGETRGCDPFTVDMIEGRHVVSCATSEGLSASVRMSVERDSPRRVGCD